MILERQFVANMFEKPELIERTTLSVASLSDNVAKVGLKFLLNEEKVTRDGFTKCYTEYETLLKTQNIDSLTDFEDYIFGTYPEDREFDWMYVENVLKNNHLKRRYIELLEKAGSEIEDVSLDTAISNLDMAMRNLEKDNNKEVAIIKADTFLDIYDRNTLEIEEAKKNDKPAYYTLHHPVLQKYVRSKIGWLFNVIGATGCVDMDTEFFTGKGWKKISDYEEGDKVLQYNKDNTAELVNPLEYHKYDADKLYSFKTKYGLDQVLSEEHNVVYFMGESKEVKSATFKEVKDMHEERVNGFGGKFKVGFEYKGGNGIALSDDEIRLMVAVMADGSYSKNKTDFCRFHIKKEHKKTALRILINNCGIKFKEAVSKNEGYTDFYFIAPMKTKIYPNSWYKATREQLQVIADEVLNWDGSYDTRNNKTSVGRFFTTIKESADFIQFVFASLDYKASIRESDRRGRVKVLNNKEYTTKSIDYIVNISKKNTTTITNGAGEKVKIEEYKTIDGKKYCFSVPSGMLVLRRNNKIFVTGNSGKSIVTLEIMLNLVMRYNERALIVTDENSDEVMLTYLHCSYFSIKYSDIEDRKVNLTKHINSLSDKDFKEYKRVFDKIDVIELPSIPLMDVESILKNAQNNDKPYRFAFMDSFDEINSDANLPEIDRYDINAKQVEKIAKRFNLILGVTNQLQTTMYRTSIEKLSQLCVFQSKSIVKKASLSLVIAHEYTKDGDSEKEGGLRIKISKCRSGGQGVIYEVKKNYDYCQLIPSDTEIGEKIGVDF